MVTDGDQYDTAQAAILGQKTLDVFYSTKPKAYAINDVLQDSPRI